MKTSKIILLFLVFWLHFTSNAQTVKSLKDSHIVGQEKRQVFQQWGDWRPKKEEVLGVNINPHYTLVWGWAAPSVNRDYRFGKDIRPLSPTGLQNQRLVTTKLQEEETNKIEKEVTKTEEATFEEYMHITSLNTELDPLYILYYKKMLEELSGRSLVPVGTNRAKFFVKKLGMKEHTIQANQQYGLIDKLAVDIELLFDKYKFAKTSDMPRGKRIIMYHECLIELRKKKQYIKYLERQTKLRMETIAKLKAFEGFKKNGTISKERTDAEIFMKVLMSQPNF